MACHVRVGGLLVPLDSAVADHKDFFSGFTQPRIRVVLLIKTFSLYGGGDDGDRDVRPVEGMRRSFPEAVPCWIQHQPLSQSEI